MTAPSLNECYDCLGLCSNITYSEVQLRKVYLKRARETHPDSNPQDSHATEAFQHLTQCYETARAHLLPCSNQPYAEPPEVDIEKYKQAYEILLSKIMLLWKDSSDALVVKQLLNAWAQRHRTESTTKAADKNAKNAGFFAHKYSSADVKKNPYEDTDTDIHFVLQIPLVDVYHKAPQKLSFFHRRWNSQTHCTYEEEASLLVHTEHRETTFFGEGHCNANKTDFCNSSCGDVCVVVVPMPDAMCSVDPNGVLHYKLVIESREMCGRPKLFNLYGKECFFVVPDDCTSDTYSSVIIQNSGLYDIKTMERAELIVDCILIV